MFPAGEQMHAPLVRPHEGIRCAAVSRISLLPDEPAQPAARSDDPGSHTNRRCGEDANTSGGERSGLSAMPWPYMQVGHVARIEDGPLRGLTGIVIKIKSGMKLVLSVSLLQRSLAVEVDRRWVSPAQPVRSTAHQGTFDRSIPLSVDPRHPEAA